MIYSSLTSVAAATAEARITDNAIVAVAGDEQTERGRAGVAKIMTGFMENPAFKGAREGVFQVDARVRLEYDQDGHPHVTVLGYDLIAFEADEASIAKEAFELIHASPMACDVARAADDTVVASPRDLIKLHVG